MTPPDPAIPPCPFIPAEVQAMLFEWYYKHAYAGTALKHPKAAEPTPAPATPPPHVLSDHHVNDNPAVPEAVKPFVEPCSQCRSVRAALVLARNQSRQPGVHAGVTVTCVRCKDIGYVLTRDGWFLASMFAAQRREGLGFGLQPLSPQESRP